jgi:hypothetical protein
LKIIPAEVAAIGCRYFKLRFAVVVPQPTTDLAGCDCSDSLGFTRTTADDGGDYIQKLAERYKISDKVERGFLLPLNHFCISPFSQGACAPRRPSTNSARRPAISERLGHF